MTGSGLAPTAFTRMFGVEYPIALAPMGGISGGALAAAVSNGGGLGLIGGGRSSRRWLDTELTLVTERTSRPWGIGFLSWAASVAAVEQALACRPHAVMLSFGDPAELAAPVLAAGVPLILQVTSLAEAEQAAALGADVIVAQGREAGGHGGGPTGGRSTLPFVPAVADRVAPLPVLAAGGIADGRGVAAALALGAAGALIGTRFEAAQEALLPPEVSKALLDGLGGDTELTSVLDIARGNGWPRQFSARVLRNAFLEQWRGRDEELLADAAARAAYCAAADRVDMDVISVWAGEGLDLVTEIGPAEAIVRELAAGAAAALARAAGTEPRSG